MPETYRVFLEWRGERMQYQLVVACGGEYIRFVREKLERHAAIPAEHAIFLDDHEAQELMLAFSMEARKHGIRPPLEAQETEAMRRHLEDMRALVFKTPAPGKK